MSVEVVNGRSAWYDDCIHQLVTVTRNPANVTRRLYFQTLMESWLVGLDFEWRHDRS